MLRSILLLIVESFILFNKQNSVQSYEVIEKVYYDLDLAEGLFKNFVSEHNKQYTAEEAEYRFQVFQENLILINKLNQERNSTLFGLTRFADLTTDEFLSSSSCVFNATAIEKEDIPIIKPPPKDLDYRTQNLVTEVKDQRYCGSCYIFGPMGDIEGQLAKKHKTLISLSEQYPLDCGSSFNCYGGAPEDVEKWLSQVGGAVSTEDYPYAGYKEKTCKKDKKVVVKVKGGRYTALRTIEQLKTMLADHGPLAIALTVSWDFRFYQKGVLRPNCFGNEPINHAVLLVGYSKDNYWIIKNSWGTKWGEKGYLLIDFENDCHIGDYLTPSEVF